MVATARVREPRADARRNVAAILAAGQECLAADPHATMSRIAEVAGVGRITLYGHFASRSDLVDAVFGAVTEQAAQALRDVDTDGEPLIALIRLVRSSWQVVHRFRAVLAAAESELSPDRVREHHDEHLTRFTHLLERGRRSGAIRNDLSTEWLVTVVYSLMHAAAGYSDLPGRSAADVEDELVATVVAALRSADPSMPTPDGAP